MDRNRVAMTMVTFMTMMAASCYAISQMYLQCFMTLLRNRRRRDMLLYAQRRPRERLRRARTNVMRLMSLTTYRRPIRLRRQTSSDWWDKAVPKFSDREWLDNFRIRKFTFDWICGELRQALEPCANPVKLRRKPLPVEKIVAIALYKLSHVAEYLVVANLFGVCKSTVHNCLYAFCNAITEVLEGRFIKFPNAEEAVEIANCFELKTNIPQLIGAIDGSHIPIAPPLEGHADLINRKLYPSLILQAIVDHQYTFRNISCVLPGACHDIDALKESEFYCNREKYIPAGHKTVDGVDIPFMLMGDPAYPLTNWLIKNYSYDQNTSGFMDSFNVYLNKGRVVVDNAFGRLKSRWRILARQSEVHYQFMPKVVAACCILHNICEARKETFSRRWLAAFLEDERDYPQPDTENFNDENQYAAADMRDHLMLTLSQRCEILTSSRRACLGL